MQINAEGKRFWTKIDLALMGLIANLDDPVYKATLNSSLQSRFKEKAEFIMFSNNHLLLLNRLLLGVEGKDGQKDPNTLESTIDQSKLGFFVDFYKTAQEKLSLKFHNFYAEDFSISTTVSSLSINFPHKYSIWTLWTMANH